MNQEELVGTITSDGRWVESNDGRKFPLNSIGTEDGFPIICIDATKVGGSGCFGGQSAKPYIGMQVSFVTNNGTHGFNFEIIPK